MKTHVISIRLYLQQVGMEGADHRKANENLHIGAHWPTLNLM